VGYQGGVFDTCKKVGELMTRLTPIKNKINNGCLPTIFVVKKIYIYIFFVIWLCLIVI
jgi:hypothetical protein